MDDARQKKVLLEAEALRDEVGVLLQRLIQARSYSGEEGEAVTLMVQAMREAGFDEADADGLGNAVGRLGDGPVTLLMDGHIDTVRVTEGEAWAHPPFAGVIEGGKIFGRGAVDEKAALAGYVCAGKAIRRALGDAALPFTLYVVGSVMEEDCDGYPLLHLIEREGIKPDFVLLGEPTDNRVFRGQRGRMELQIETRGKSAHGAHNHEGINAVTLMAPVVSAIDALDRELKPAAPLGKGSITVSEITSHGPSLCSVPDGCRIHIDRRMTVGETKESVVAELRALLQRCGVAGEVRIPEYQGTSWKGTAFSQEAYFPTWILEEDHRLVRAAQDTVTRVFGAPRPSSCWSFSTNGVATAGRLGIPTIGFAPGEEDRAHSVREEIVLEDLFQAMRFYTLFPFVLAGGA